MSPAPLHTPHLSAAGIVPLFGPTGEIRPLEEIECEVIRFAIAHYRGQMSEVARRLQIGRSTLYRRLKDLGLEGGDGPSSDDETVATK